MFASLLIWEERYRNNLDAQDLWYDGMQFSVLLTELRPTKLPTSCADRYSRADPGERFCAGAVLRSIESGVVSRPCHQAPPTGRFASCSAPTAFAARPTATPSPPTSRSSWPWPPVLISPAATIGTGSSSARTHASRATCWNTR